MDTALFYIGEHAILLGEALAASVLLGLVLLLVAHFVVIHYSGTGDINFNIVRDRLMHPTWGPVWKTMTMVLLVMSLFHALNGTWGVLLDYIRKTWARLTLFSLIVVIGLVLVTLGSITVLSFRAPPTAERASEIPMGMRNPMENRAKAATMIRKTA